MHPFIYTAPISKAEYLGGRFLAAFAINALILLVVQLGILAALFVPGVDPGIVGPFRLSVYLSSYGVLALPTAFIITAIQFSLAALNRRAIVSYLGSVFRSLFPSRLRVYQRSAYADPRQDVGSPRLLHCKWPLSETWTPLREEYRCD
jgi:hypothetical protein